MAIGQLVHLDDAVTDNTGDFITCTIPNDGSVAAGDLLIWVAIHASGSRTMAVTGITGFTTPGIQAGTGHSSQVWYKIAEAGDLGDTITVTPSTGNIKQVMLLGRVRGVNQTNPLGSPTKIASVAVASGTTKTTPSFADVGVGSREISIVCDSRGASTPQTTDWASPGGQTVRAEIFTTDTTQASSCAWGDSDATVSGTVGTRLWTADQSAFGTAWTLAVATGDTVQALTGANETDTAQPLVGTKTLTPAVGQHTALDFPGNKVRALGASAASTETAQALTPGASAPLGVASESDAAQPFIIGNGQVLGTAFETNAAQPLPHTKNVLLAPAVEVDTAGEPVPGAGPPPKTRTYTIPVEARTVLVPPR